MGTIDASLAASSALANSSPLGFLHPTLPTPPPTPRPYECAMAAASGAAAAAAAAASAMSSIFGPSGDAFPHLPVLPPPPPVPALRGLPDVRFAGPPQWDHCFQASAADRGPSRLVSAQVVVWPDGRVDRFARAFETQSGPVPPPPRPPSPTQSKSPSSHPSEPRKSSTTAATNKIDAAATGDAADDDSDLSSISYQTLCSPSEQRTLDDLDDRSSLQTDDPAFTLASKLQPCWSCSPSEDEDEGQGDRVKGGAVHGAGARRMRFTDMETLKNLLRGVFQAFRQIAHDKEPCGKSNGEESTGGERAGEEASAVKEPPDDNFHTAFDSSFLQPSDDEECMLETDDEAVQTVDIEMRESSTDMSGEEDMQEEAPELRMETEVEEIQEPCRGSHTRRPWPMPLSPPPPPPPPRPTPAQANAAAFAATTALPLPPGAVFFESGTYVAEGADREYVERMLSVRESALRAAERAANNASGYFTSFFGHPK